MKEVVDLQGDCISVRRPLCRPIARREIWGLIEELAREGTRVVVSTQYLDEVARCDEVLFLHRGRLLVQDSPENLIRRFPHRVFRIPEMREARLGS